MIPVTHRPLVGKKQRIKLWEDMALEPLEQLWQNIDAIFSLGGTFCISPSHKNQNNKFKPSLSLHHLLEEMGVSLLPEIHLETLACRDSSYITFSEMLWYFRRLKTFSENHEKPSLVLCGTDQLGNLSNVAELFQTHNIFVGAMDPFGSDRFVNIWLALHAAKEMRRSGKNGALLVQGGCIAEPPFITKEDPQSLLGAFGSRLQCPPFSLHSEKELIKYRDPWTIDWTKNYQPDFREIFDNTMAYGHLVLGKILTITARLDIYQAEFLLQLVEKTLHTSQQFLGILIRGFGSGGIQTTMPLRDQDGVTKNHMNPTALWKMLKKIAPEIPIVMTSQCARGGVTEDYEYAEMLKEASVILGGFFSEDFLDVYMTMLAVASLTQTSEESGRGKWMRVQLEKFFAQNIPPV